MSPHTSESIKKFLGLFVIVGGYYFFNLYLGVSVYHAGIFVGFLVLSVGSARIKHWTRYPLAMIFVLGALGILSLSFLPQFDEGPNMDAFIKDQHLMVYSFASQPVTNQAQIHLTQNESKTTLGFDPQQTSQVDWKGNREISFLAQDVAEDQFAVLQFQDNSQLFLSPQSKAIVRSYLSTEGVMYNIEILQGEYSFFSSDIDNTTFRVQLSGAQRTTENFSGELNTFLLSYHQQLSDNYRAREELFFLNQLGGAYLHYPIVYKILEAYMDISFSLAPEMYADNIINFTAYKPYFPTTTATDFRSYFQRDDVNSSIQKRSLDGLNSTQFLKFLRK